MANCPQSFMYYWNSLPQDEDGMAEVSLSIILDLFDYCGVKLTDDDAQVNECTIISTLLQYAVNENAVVYCCYSLLCPKFKILPYKSMNMCVNMCINMCMNMCINMCIIVCINMCIFKTSSIPLEQQHKAI